MDSKPLESSFQRKVLTDLRKLKNCYFHKHQAGSIRGVPDIIGCVAGVFFALELKRHRKALARPLQKHTIERINHAGGVAIVVFPELWQSVFELLKKISEGEESVQNLIQRIAKSELQHCYVQARAMH